MSERASESERLELRALWERESQQLRLTERESQTCRRKGQQGKGRERVSSVCEGVREGVSE